MWSIFEQFRYLQRKPADIQERTMVEFMPSDWPKSFYEKPSGSAGMVCADIEKEPCENCDGKKCVIAYIQSNM